MRWFTCCPNPLTKAVPAREPLFHIQPSSRAAFFMPARAKTTRRTAQEGGFMPNAEPTSTTSDPVEGQQTEPTQPDALAELQAKYDALLETSRKWEGRSKANAEKAKQYDALAKQQADAQAAADEAKADAAKLKDELAAANRSLAVSRIAAEKGVDAEILAAMSAEDEDGIAANADKLAASYAARNLYPSVTDGGASAAPAITAESIESIKDPLARVMARAEHINLYN